MTKESAAAYQSECRPGGPYGALEITKQLAAPAVAGTAKEEKEERRKKDKGELRRWRPATRAHPSARRRFAVRISFRALGASLRLV